MKKMLLVLFLILTTVFAVVIERAVETTAVEAIETEYASVFEAPVASFEDNGVIEARSMTNRLYISSFSLVPEVQDGTSILVNGTMYHVSFNSNDTITLTSKGEVEAKIASKKILVSEAFVFAYFILIAIIMVTYLLLSEKIEDKKRNNKKNSSIVVNTTEEEFNNIYVAVVAEKKAAYKLNSFNSIDFGWRRTSSAKTVEDLKEDIAIFRSEVARVSSFK